MKTKSKTNSDRFVIIIAGGRGEGFWLVSRETPLAVAMKPQAS